MKGRGQKDDMSDAGTDEPMTVGTFETLRDEGEHFVHVKQYERAIESFTKAMEMKADDKTCLVTRSKCHLMLGNSAQALEDAENALKADEGEKPKDIRALCMKAEALYQKGDFENALVFFHRGNKLRPELQEFRLGIQKSQEAINNSIGGPDSVELEVSGDLSVFYKEKEPQQKQQKVATYSKPKSDKKETKEALVKPKQQGTAKTTKELLGELYEDRAFLEALYDGLTGKEDKNPADKFIKKRAIDGLEYLGRRADFWRQQKPMYARERDRKRQRQQMSGRGSRGETDPMQYILEKLEEIDEAQEAGRYKQSLQKSKKTLDKLQTFSESRVENKQALVANLYSCMGNAHLELGNFEEACSFHQQDLDLGRKHKIEEAESRALDNLGRAKARMGQHEEAIRYWNEKLELPKEKSALETTWLYHEIGRCQLELDNNRDAKEGGERSLAAAEEARDRTWQLHATVLIAQAEVKLEDLQAAVDNFDRAKEIAEELGDKSACDAIEKAIAEVNDRIVKGENNSEATADREGQSKEEESKEEGTAGEERTKAVTEESEKGREQEREETAAPEAAKTERPDGGTSRSEVQADGGRSRSEVQVDGGRSQSEVQADGKAGKEETPPPQSDIGGPEDDEEKQRDTVKS